MSNNEDGKIKVGGKDNCEVHKNEKQQAKEEDVNPETAKVKAKDKLKHATKKHVRGETSENETAASKQVKILGGSEGILEGNNKCVEPAFSKTGIRLYKAWF